MKKVIISFTSRQDVLDFLHAINPEHVEYSLKNNIVICACSDEEIQLAIERFGAEVDELTSKK